MIRIQYDWSLDYGRHGFSIFHHHKHNKKYELKYNENTEYRGQAPWQCPVCRKHLPRTIHEEYKKIMTLKRKLSA